MKNWALPEIERRQKEGKLPKPVELRHVQVLFAIDGSRTIRINEEVKAIFKAKLAKGKSVKKGQALRESDVEDVQFGQLLEEDSDFGHITIWRFKDEWKVYFSFIYENRKAKATLELGESFLQSAKADIEAARLGPAVNSLFVASENVAKARLFLQPLDDVHKPVKTHKGTQLLINRYKEIGRIIPSKYAKNHNKLLGLRELARYDPSYDIDKKFLNTSVAEIENLVSITRGSFR